MLFIVAGLFLLQRGAFWHPLTMYLIFHAYTVTWRIWQVAFGRPLMYEGQPGRDPITLGEFTRAAIFAEIAFALFIAGCWWGHKVADARSFHPVFRRPINRSIVGLVCLVCLPLGWLVFSSIKSGDVAQNAFTQTNYFSVMAMWPFACLSMLICTYGFRMVLVLPLAAYLTIVGTQGYHRFMLLLPLIFSTAYYLQSHRRRWPGVAIITAGLGLFIVFPVLKHVGRAYQAGDMQEAARLLSDAFLTSSSYEEVGTNEQFLDQLAGAVSLVDDVGKVYKGSTYLAIVTLPVPRILWPGKPGLADHLQDVSTPARPFAAEGRIITYIGEAYYNFRYAGLVIVPFLLGYFLTAWCRRSTDGPMNRYDRYVYTLSFMTFLQVYRDGLISLVVFSICHNLPMLFAWVLHAIPGFAPKVLDAPAYEKAPSCASKPVDVPRRGHL